MKVLEASSLKKNYEVAQGKQIEILKGIDFAVEKGSTVSITGHSGSGKTTFLSLLAGMDHPTSGIVSINGTDITSMNEKDLTRFRAANVGFIFQRFYLMSHLSALENVSLPLDIAGRKDSVKKAKEALEKVGLGSRFDHFPDKLSGGECQRVAIARALVTGPDIILADEPTGNLDQETGTLVADLLFQLVTELNQTMIVVTHNIELAGRCGKKYALKNGVLN